MKKIRTPQEGAGAALSARSTAASNNAPQTPSEGVLSGFSAIAEQFIAASQSAATKRAYASDLKHFFANGGSVPASPAALAEYLARCAEKLSVATLERRLTAIHKAHLEKNLESPARSETVKRVMQGVRRVLGTKQRQVQPIVKDDLLAALVMIDRQKMPIKAARDRALLLIGFASAMRRSELAAVRVEHLSYLANGVEIFLPSSKTDQERHGRTVFIPHANGERCPVRALAHWLEVSEIREGFVFRAVSRHDRVSRDGLSAQSVALVVKASVERVGGDAKKVSGHSLRAGYCTSAAEKGLQPWQIREQTGHKSDVTLARYIRPVARRNIPSLL
ncbi:site-specific integrase [Acidovorax sp. A79]|uniref:site-specific integrase n=1 Tax=Acidovorax sp. A79 TaxID=3056107 RepID=UPI0034E8E599